MFRFIDPRKLRIESSCFEVSADYVGERVEGVRLKSFVLVKPGSGDGIEVVGELRDRLGIVVEVEADDAVATALESLVPEIINRVRGLRLDFRKERAQLVVARELLKPELPNCIAELIHSSLKSIGIANRVIAICDDFDEWLSIAEKIHASRIYRLDDDDVDVFYACTSCQFSLPNHACIISPQRPSCCGTSYSEAKTAEKLGIVGYYKPVSAGSKLLDDEYSGVNEFIASLNPGVGRVRLHSVLDAPLLTGLYADVIIFYIPEEDGFGIVDREWRGSTPLGLSFAEMERFIAGRQVAGFVGECMEYLRSRRFLASEGGWRRVVWASDDVRQYIEKHNLPAKI